MEPIEPSLDLWFKREILPHEGALLRYLYRVWPRRDDVTDLRQETYARVFESARLNRPLNPNAFLFATARNLMTDRLRRERVVSIEAVGDIEELNVLIDELTPERRTIARQELKRLAGAFDCLPPKCREVIWLRRVQELSQREVAVHLRITESAVEKHISRAVRLLNAKLRQETEAGPVREAEDSDNEKNHGTQQPD
jgi:RNA polymerase sigma-70 factor (ECF subfamily)